MSQKVLLITPPYHCGVLESAGTWLPTAFVYLAGSLRKAGYSVEIYDAMSKFHTYQDIRAHLSEAQPHVVATGAITATIYDCINVLKLAKELNQETLTILGGVHPTFCWKEILKEHHDSLDYVVRGEGEETLVELLEAIKDGHHLVKEIPGLSLLKGGKMIRYVDRPEISDISELPSPFLTGVFDSIKLQTYTNIYTFAVFSR